MDFFKAARQGLPGSLCHCFYSSECKKEGGDDPSLTSFQKPRGHFRCSSRSQYPLPFIRQHPWFIACGLFLLMTDMAMSAKATCGHWHVYSSNETSEPFLCQEEYFLLNVLTSPQPVSHLAEFCCSQVCCRRLWSPDQALGDV